MGAPDEFWIYDLDKQQIKKLDLGVVGDRRAAWVGDNTFVLLTTQGVIEYDIQKSQLKIIAKPNELNLDPLSGSDSISPDGRFLLYQHYGGTGSTVKPEIGICVLR